MPLGGLPGDHRGLLHCCVVLWWVDGEPGGTGYGFLTLVVPSWLLRVVAAVGDAAASAATTATTTATVTTSAAFSLRCCCSLMMDDERR